MGSDQEDSKPITLDTTDFQESFVTSGVFSVTELIQVSRTPVVTGTGPNFSLGELQGHLAYDLNPASTGMRRTLPSTSSSGSKRHKSGSMEEDVDTSPGGDYYTSPSSPTSSSRNWTEDMEGGISSPVKKTEMDKSPFNSPSPQDSPRLSSFTQHHRPVIAVHSGECLGWVVVSPEKNRCLRPAPSCAKRCDSLSGLSFPVCITAHCVWPLCIPRGQAHCTEDGPRLRLGTGPAQASHVPKGEGGHTDVTRGFNTPATMVGSQSLCTSPAFPHPSVGR
uniref:Nuclear factor 1 C-type n=1 Tax=Castor canadensis TaxID=51338 RepID=A0A8C0WPE7_CASCN